MLKQTQIRLEQGFQAYALCNEEVEITIVPELGARIVSLENRRTGREWMWHPGQELRLFRNHRGDDFSRSTLAGADECIPTVAPCLWQGTSLPDHGEAWSMPWTVDAAAWGRGCLRTVVDLPLSPFTFERTVSIQAHQVRLEYLLVNHGDAAEKFLWALHPLFRIYGGDCLDLAPAIRQSLNGQKWLDDPSSVIPPGGCSKLFAGPLKERRVAIRNPLSGDALEMRWTGTDNNMLGLWLTRGGWHGHHHLAVEPTNGAPDALSEAARRDCCGSIAARERKSWEITISLPADDTGRVGSLCPHSAG